MAGELQRVPETSRNVEILKHAITINQIIGRFRDSAVSIDHGDLAGLSDDDHTQYYNTTRLTAVLADYALTTDLANYYTIAAANLTFAPIAHTHAFADLPDINTNRVLGRYSAGTGDIQELTIGSGLTLTAGGALQVDNIPTTAINNLDEAIDDRVDALLVEGSNITLTYNDGAGTLTIASTAGSSPTTTAGDLIKRGASADERLAIGSEGEVLTVVSGAPAWAAATGGGGEQFVYKAADTTRASTTTLADDPDLTVTLDANSVYEFEFHVLTKLASVPGLKLTPAFSGTTTWVVVDCFQSANGTADYSASSVAYDMSQRTSNSLPMTIGFTGFAQMANWCFKGMISVGASGGTFALQWAQQASSATAARVDRGSFLRVKKVA